MKTLHTAYRVTDLAVSLRFYLALGYEEVGQVSLDDGATLVMLKFPGEDVVTLELVYRPADRAVPSRRPGGTADLLAHRPRRLSDRAGSVAAGARRRDQPGGLRVSY